MKKIEHKNFLLFIMICIMPSCIIFFAPTIANVPASTRSDEISVSINSKEIVFDQAPIIKNGRTLVPIRPVCEALGADVYWNDEARTVVIVRNKTKVLLKIGENSFTLINTTQDEKALNDLIDGNASNQVEEKELDCAPEIISGRTVIPIRAVCEALNADVKWNGNDNSITIKATNIKKNTNKTFYDDFCDIFVTKSLDEAIVNLFYEAENVYNDWMYYQEYEDIYAEYYPENSWQLPIIHPTVKSSLDLKNLMHKYFVNNMAEEYIKKLDPHDINGKLYAQYFGGVGTNLYEWSRNVVAKRESTNEYKIIDDVTGEYNDGTVQNIVYIHRAVKEENEWKIEFWTNCKTTTWRVFREGENDGRKFEL